MSNSTLITRRVEGPDADRVGELVWDTLVLLLAEASKVGGWQVGLGFVTHTIGQIAAASAGDMPPHAVRMVTEMLEANLRNGVEAYAAKNLPPAGHA